ncbi:MAG: hypothetical protein R3A10_14265 [Caldilineaceae bacterium]
MAVGGWESATTALARVRAWHGRPASASPRRNARARRPRAGLEPHCFHLLTGAGALRRLAATRFAAVAQVTLAPETGEACSCRTSRLSPNISRGNG